MKHNCRNFGTQANAVNHSEFSPSFLKNFNISFFRIYRHTFFTLLTFSTYAALIVLLNNLYIIVIVLGPVYTVKYP